MTAQEILTEVENLNIEVYCFGYGDIENPLPNGIGEWKQVEQVGGEDEGSNWYSVKHFKDHDVYIKTKGYYTSYNGTDFEYGYGQEVFPVEVKVIKYKTVKPNNNGTV